MEIMVVSVLALVVFGPDKLPEIARTVGGFIKQLRAMADEVKQEFSDGFDVEDEPDDEKVAALAQDDSEVAHLDDDGEESSDVAEDKDRPAAGAPDPAEHPVAGAIRADREASGRSEGA
jgi:sec-independent protein translocase protein TatB